MGETQADIARVCRLLDSDKATERKKNADNIKQLLRQVEIVRLLDANSDGAKKNVISWDFIFKSTQAYVNREMECLRVQKQRNSQSTSSTVANNQEKKRKEVMSLLKFVIRTADERDRCRLNGKDLVCHIIIMLKSQEKACVGDYQNILLKYVLTSRTYCCEVTSQMWLDLINIISGIINTRTGERSLSAKTFFHIITAAGTQVDLKPNRCFQFFTNVFTDIRKETNTQVLEYLVNSLLTFCKSVAIDCRGQLCQLGEDVIPALLQIWSKPHPLVKEYLVGFMRLQMSVHHPNGVHLENNGAWCTNTSHWKKCLQKLYEAISVEIQQSNGRIRGQSMKLESGLKSTLIELCADICHQPYIHHPFKLFWFHSETSLMPVDSNKFEGPSSSKRRKIDAGWNVLKDTLTNSQETPALLGWLQITAKMLSKFPSSVPSKEYVPLLSSLHQLQIECKRPEVISTVMVCLKCLAGCYIQLLENSVEEMSSKTTWRNVWLATLRTCSSHALQDASFQLLEKIVKEKLADSDTELWKLLTDAGSSSSESSLQFLWQYLTTLPLPEYFQVFQNELPSHYPLRHQLFDWLLPPVSKIEQQGYNVCVSYSKILSRLPMDLLSRVLVVLTQRVCYNTSECVRSFNSERGTTEKFERDLEEIENIYILSTFDKRSEIKMIDLATLNETESVSSDNNTVPELLSYLIQRMIEISQKLLQTSSTECSIIFSPSSSTTLSADKKLEILVKFASLSTKILGLLLCLNAFNFEELTDSPLYLVTMHVFKAVSDVMLGFLRQKEEAKKAVQGQSFTATLSDLFLCGFSSLNTGRERILKTMMKVVRSLIPKDLIEYMLQIITKEPRQLNKTRVVVDEFDGTIMDSEDVVDDFEVNDSVPNSMSDQKINSESVPENDKLRILYMKIVSSLCTCLDDVPNQSSEFHSSVQNKIFEYFASEEFDVLKPVHSKLFFAAAFILCSGPIQGQHVLAIVQNVRTSISKYRKDQECCKEGLSLLTLLAKQFGRTEAMNDEDMEEALARSLHLLKAFWNLRDASYCSSVRLQIAKCMDTFIRVILCPLHSVGPDFLLTLAMHPGKIYMASFSP